MLIALPPPAAAQTAQTAAGAFETSLHFASLFA
jgi:hypothetical protein